METTLTTCWREGRAALNGWLMIPSPVTAELVAAQDFDAITIDMQHGLVGYESVLSMLQAMRSSRATLMVRIPALEPGIVAKVLDAGAMGIICPMVNTVEDAQELVRCCRYPPEGARSYGPLRATLVHGASYAEDANRTITVLAMVETTEALENVAAVAAVPGIDGVYIGPSDLALSHGELPKFDHSTPEMLQRLTRIRTAAHAAGIRVGIHCASAEYAMRMIDDGFDLVTLGSDARWIAAAAAATVAGMRQRASKD